MSKDTSNKQDSLNEANSNFLQSNLYTYLFK